MDFAKYDQTYNNHEVCKSNVSKYTTESTCFKSLTFFNNVNQKLRKNLHLHKIPHPSQKTITNEKSYC